MSKPVILCVDDEKIVLDSLKEQLRSGLDGNYMIETAESGPDALEIVEELFEDDLELGVTICDQIMPGMKGDELLRAVHNLSPKTLNILLTGQADAQAVGNAVNYANLYRYIVKPWQATDLIMTVREALRSYFQDKQLEEQNEILQKTNQDLKQLNRAYERFVPREFLSFLGRESITEVGLGDQVQAEITILFSDIRSFTSLSEQMTPQENFDFINAYLSRISPIIREHKGFIDKYIGDSVMALFSGQANGAIQAAIAIQQSVASYNQYRQKKDRQLISIGIGLHAGNVMLGTVGELERMESTVISDAVNLASRLEGLTKLYGAAILVSEKILFGLDRPTQYKFRFLDKVKVKGKKEPVSVFEILDGSPDEVIASKLKTRDDFGAGLTHYVNQEWSEAKKYFNNVLTLHPEDKAAMLYLERINLLMKEDIPSDWEGVSALIVK